MNLAGLMRLGLVLLSLISLTACGLKGDLYLPDSTAPSPDEIKLSADDDEAVE